jgi:glycosyltransferase involved in cell wall biosynthesis
MGSNSVLFLMSAPDDVAAIAIGRNEGERLKRCLRSLEGQAAELIFVDSGSTDGSAAFAESIGVTVVELDMSKPFSMARARNAGAAKARERLPHVNFLQFVDGDCEVRPDWIPEARAFLEAHPDVVAVCGRRRERFPEASIYNAMCDIEWNTPVGEAKATGGDVLMRAEAFFAAEGFNEALIAGEEPELCFRLRQAGGNIHRIDQEMTLHDANIHRFGMWWKRNVRCGYGSSDVRHRWKGKMPADEIPFQSIVRSTPIWSIGWLMFSILLAVFHPALIFVGAGVWGLQAVRIAQSVRHRTESVKVAAAYGFFTLIGKWAQWSGILKYHSDRRKGKVITLIEYK